MGRPLNKKYFGNKNSPYTDFQGSTTPDSGIGGRVASVAVAGTNNNYTEIPALTVAAPTLVGGVNAEVEVVSMGVATVSVAAGGTLYAVGDVLTLVGLGTGTAATVTVATVDAPETGVITEVTVTSAGAYTTVADLTALATTDNSVAGSGATIDVTGLKINAVSVTEAGSGYTSAPAITDLPDGNATFTVSLSTVAGSRAIKAFAYLTGGSRLAADIIKQDNKIQYKVENATGVAVVQLVDSQANAAGEMDITAYDSEANEYWVKKLTARKAVLTRKVSGNGQFASGTSVPWTLDAAVEDYSVKIDNA